MPWSEADLAYMAGIIDGEGSICVFHYWGRPHQRNGKRYLRHKTGLSISNTSFDLMKWIVDRFGSKIRVVKRHREDWKQAYHWQVGYAQAYEIVKALLPYLVVKHKQAALLIEFQEMGAFRGRRDIPEEVQSRRIAIADEVAFLNNRKRGEPKYAVDARRRTTSYAQSQHAKQEEAVAISGK